MGQGAGDDDSAGLGWKQFDELGFARTVIETNWKNLLELSPHFMDQNGNAVGVQ